MTKKELDQHPIDSAHPDTRVWFKSRGSIWEEKRDEAPKLSERSILMNRRGDAQDLSSILRHDFLSTRRKDSSTESSSKLMKFTDWKYG
jgi:hypothetical protein